MSSLFPPILESQRASIPSQTVPANFVIPVTLPLSIDIYDIIGGGPAMKSGGHVQVIIRRQVDMQPWCDVGSASVPERDVIYLPGTALSPDGLYITVPSSTIKAFTAGDTPGAPLELQTGRMYTIQIRFGNRQLWSAVGETFAYWKAAEIANSRFGEWSNTQRMFVYGVPVSGGIINVSIIDDIIGKLEWQYTPISQDPIVQVRATYSWSVPDSYGNLFRSRNVEFSNSDGQGSGAFGTVDLEAMRFAKIEVGLRFTTVNNTIFDWTATVPTYPFVADNSGGNSIQPFPIIGEELEDGVLAMTFGGTMRRNTSIHTSEKVYYKIYRVDVITLETVFLKQIDGEIGSSFIETIRDYSVEMGAEYVYIAASYGVITGKVHYVLVPITGLTPSTWNPPIYDGYGRQMDFQGNIFLTTQHQQLRLQGNVNVSSFQRNTSDQITTTIGGKYPFYSRSAEFNYRTLSLQGLISINFDTTHTFLKFKAQEGQNIVDAKNRIAQDYQTAVSALDRSAKDYPQKVRALQEEYYRRLGLIYQGINPPPVPSGAPTTLTMDWLTGQLWFVEKQDVDKIVVRTPDLFSMDEHTPNRKRVRDYINPKNEWIAPLDNYEYVRGPATIYDSHLRRDTTQIQDSDRASNIIYVERKFRESVMEWLSNGKPKLLRSETEGNMIVMLTGISFTPFNKSRTLYSLSATVTEVAECNLSNLILYGLVPIAFEPYYIPGIEFDFVPGAVDIDIDGVSGTIPPYPFADGNIYGLQDFQWVDITPVFTLNNDLTNAVTIPNPLNDGNVYALKDGRWVDITTSLTISEDDLGTGTLDILNDGQVYVIKDGKWINITSVISIQ